MLDGLTLCQYKQYFPKSLQDLYIEVNKRYKIMKFRYKRINLMEQ